MFLWKQALHSSMVFAPLPSLPLIKYWSGGLKALRLQAKLLAGRKLRPANNR